MVDNCHSVRFEWITIEDEQGIKSECKRCAREATRKDERKKIGETKKEKDEGRKRRRKKERRKKKKEDYVQKMLMKHNNNRDHNNHNHNLCLNNSNKCSSFPSSSSPSLYCKSQDN